MQHNPPVTARPPHASASPCVAPVPHWQTSQRNAGPGARKKWEKDIYLTYPRRIDWPCLGFTRRQALGYIYIHPCLRSAGRWAVFAAGAHRMGWEGVRYRHSKPSRDQAGLSVASSVVSMGPEERWSQVTTQFNAADALYSWTQGASPINGKLVIPGNQSKLTASQSPCGIASGPMDGCLAVSGDFNENKRAGSSRAINVWY